MDLLSDLVLGLHVAASAQNLLAVLTGICLGTLGGMLPRLSPVTMIALLIPAIHGLDPGTALIFLAAVFCGTRSGAMLASIVIQHVPPGPGVPVSAADGNSMVRQGRVGTALVVASLTSLFAGCAGVAVIALLAQPLTELAFRFGAAEIFSLMVLSLVCAVVMSRGALAKALAMAVLGLLLGQIGHQPASGTPAFLSGFPLLADGPGLVPLALGLFGCGEVIVNLGRIPAVRNELLVAASGQNNSPPSRSDLHKAWPVLLRGTVVGALLGILPGRGAQLAAFVSYRFEQKLSKSPSRAFGDGAVEGVAASESSASAGTQSSFIPVLLLGLPSNAVMALVLGAMTTLGIQAGPLLSTGKPQLFWGLIVSLWFGNLMAAIVSPALWSMWHGFLILPYRWIACIVLVACCFGAYLAGPGGFDGILLMAFASFITYILFKLDCDMTPLLLGFVFGPLMDEGLRRALQLSNGDWSVFLTRPWSVSFLLTAWLLVMAVLLPRVRRTRSVAFQ